MRAGTASEDKLKVSLVRLVDVLLVVFIIPILRKEAILMESCIVMFLEPHQALETASWKSACNVNYPLPSPALYRR